MPYEGEFAAYRPLYRIAESERVKRLASRWKVCDPTISSTCHPSPNPAPPTVDYYPRFILAIDGSDIEIDVRNGYPGAKVGYCTVASVLLDLQMIGKLDTSRPVDPQKFRETEEAATIDAVFPGSNVIIRRQSSARASFREELFDHFQDVIVDEEDRSPLIDTYEALLSLKPDAKSQQCPYSESDGCTEHLKIGLGHTECPSCHNPIFSTDALRIHERFRELGTNGEAFGLIRQVWERLLLIHLLRCFEQRGVMEHLRKLVFFVDGPLAIFGPPAWLSAAIRTELKRLNSVYRAKTECDLIILGIEKSGQFVTHFDEIDQTETSGQPLFNPRTYMLLTDSYIKTRIQYSDSTKRYGVDTYFGRKLFYKTKNGARIVANIPFLNDAQDTLDSDDIGLYQQFATICALIDNLVSSRFPNAITPIVSAHSQAAIPLNLGAKVLQQLTQALMGENNSVN